MDNTNDIRQQLTAEKNKLRQDILDGLKELYFLRNNGQMCDYQVWSSKDSFRSAVSDIDDEDLKSDQKFTHLLNLKYEEPKLEPIVVTPSITSIPTATTTPSITTPTTSTKVVSSNSTTTTTTIKTDPSSSLTSNNTTTTHPITSVPSTNATEAPLEVTNSTTCCTSPISSSLTPIVVTSTSPAVIPSSPTIITEVTSIKSPPISTTVVSPSVTPPPTQPATTNSSNALGSPSKEESPTRISKAVDPIVNSTAVAAESIQRQNVEKAKHEHAVLARITELRKQGLWSAQRLPKAQEPARPKCHWDNLLEEGRWLFSDFRCEKKWKRDSSRRLAYAACRFINNKRTQQERLEKEKLQHIRKVAATLSKEVRSFWSSIEKIVDYRQQTKLEETRKKAMDLHLNYILDQTSKFSNSCIEEPQTQEQQLAITQPESNYLIKEDGDSDNAEKKESVINNDERIRYNQEVDNLAAGAQSIQPKGNTFETTTVSTKVPFLLKHKLREYQHIGLDWLVAMYRKQLNGILADEMGLGKTIQTIALLAHLACEEQEWGPHLIVVPTSVMLNWEMEFKKWCPAFKILTYYGTPKERKLKRVGWSRPNSFHVCITSYRIVIQDHAAFRRKQWCYFILDEAHYIKNFKSQRWQMLLNFNSQRRLLLTGTPLQNDLKELWSLMHFLMPGLFDSFREFKDWFGGPFAEMIEGTREVDPELVQRLHIILRPFLLRRLKCDVEKQLPKKREVIKYCRLSKRQRFLYEEFMSLSKTKETLASGNFLSVINVLMQLRKVCNHPNLFEPRPTVSPFRMSGISYQVPNILLSPLDYNPSRNVNLRSIQLLVSHIGSSMTSIARDSIKLYKGKRTKLVEELEGCRDVKDSDSCTQDGDFVMEVDDTTNAIDSDRITAAYETIKGIQLEDKRSTMDFIANINDIRCDRIYSPYFIDLVDSLYMLSLDKMVKHEDTNVFSNGNGMVLCSVTQDIKSNPRWKLGCLSSLIAESIKSPEQLVDRLTSIIERYIFCVTVVNSTPITLHVAHSPKRKVEEIHLQKSLYSQLAPKFNFLNKIMTNMQMSFPELRLIEYDCGKLQALGQLLIDLKANEHRVLIFTQMSRMLDILEQFLNYHGHTYLRLDGATKIDQRQILMERFNNDKKIFCFILSTRSGGIGVNLTGADTVIFYDSDWNPTMDAQAQDRCHRIGQTRDVTIYRLISEDTIEQNIYRKAQQKRMLGDLAIEDGNFGLSSCIKRNAIHELFERYQEPVDTEALVEVEDHSEEIRKANLNKWEQAISKCEAEAGEEMDVDAIKTARADVDTDLREFDENVPLTEESSPIEKSEKEQQIDNIVSQLTPVQQYAVKFLEVFHHDNFREELEQAEKDYIQELEHKKSQWEQSRIDMLKEQAIMNESRAEDYKTMVTYPRGAKCEHVQFMLDGSRKVEDMPLWAPPTPPTSPPSPVEDDNQFRYQPQMTPAMAARISAMGGLRDIFGTDSDNKTDNRYFIHEKDVYVDYSSHFFYELDVMPESQLPPIHQSYSENEITSYTIGSKKIRLTGTPVVPGNYLQAPSHAPHLQQHLQNLTNVANSSDANAVAMATQQPVRKPKVRRDEVICLPRSLFDRPQGNCIKARRDLKLQKLRCVTKGNDSDPFAMQKFFHLFSYNSLGQSMPPETIVHHVQRQTQQFPNSILLYHQDQIPSWTIQEEWAILMVIQHLQDLPVNLNILTPGHTPNWELVSEVVSDIGFAQRSFKMCEYHYALEVQKREMTRDSSWDERALQSSPASSLDGSQPPSKKFKKNKNQQTSTDGPSGQTSTTNSKSSTPAPSIPFRQSKTGGMLAHDRSLQFSLKDRYTAIRDLRLARPKTHRARFASSHDRSANNLPALVRDDKRMIDYERPQKPETIILELAEERKRRALAARQKQGHMMSLCSCCRGTPTASTVAATAAAVPIPRSGHDLKN